MPVPTIPTIPTLGHRRSGVSSSAAAAAFSPTDLSGLLGWWKADALVLSDTNAVSSWADSSGSGRTLTQASGTLQPIYNTNQQNSLPAVTFDGTNDYLATAAFASPTAGCTVMSVLKLTSADIYKTLICHAAAASWAAPYARVLARVTDNAASTVWQFIVQDAADAASTLATGAATTTWQIMEFVYDQTDMKVRRNGTQLATKARTGLLTSSTQPVFIGADTSLSDNWKGQVGEIVYLNRGADSTELGQLRTYLQTKWGL